MHISGSLGRFFTRPSGVRHRMRPFSRLFVGVALFTAGGVLANSQEQERAGPLPSVRLKSRPENKTNPNARIDVNMVLVPVSVTDQADRPVNDLTSNSFRVFEDGVEQTVVSLHHEDGPVSIGFVFDASSSMKTRMEPSLKAIEQFLKATVPGDEFFLLRFSDRPAMVTGFTPDPDVILTALPGIQAEGWTSLQDAIFMAAQRMKSAKNPRRALVILSDGGDNNSRYSESEVRSLIRESDVRVYSIGLFERPKFLEKLANDTGGRSYWVHHIDDLPDTVERLSTDLRNQYVLGYSTQNRQNDGKYRKVRVELLESIRRFPLHVFWRRGYYAPPD
jgi:Ca-activated chloride channel homolog